ncbi:MAG: glycosyltransferase family 4 protein [Gammaproteobacteria bacterium]|nr:glycosyltransferase family 4 protein [Gammaproteobacteria bacterium]
MRLLLLAPEIAPPWTEGRKRFVIDLANALKRQQHEVTLLVSGDPTAAMPADVDAIVLPAHGRISRLLGPGRNLPRVAARMLPDCVINFPYGTFSGLHHWPSRGYMRWIDRLCVRIGVPCLTVLYSIDQHTRPGSLAGWARNLVTGPLPHWRGPSVPLGRDVSHWPQRLQPAGTGRSLLFLAGMWQPTRERFDHVLDVRGLRVLLRAGEKLAEQGVTLKVAAPLFADAQCRQWLNAHPDNTWPEHTMSLADTVEVPAVFHAADVFVFPYAEDITQFTPTSVVESMLAGTPVVMSDLPFLRQLGPTKIARRFAPDDALALADEVLKVLDTPGLAVQQSAIAKAHAHQAWDIDTSAKALLAVASELAAQQRT